jgi:bifunctional DNase/RNase
MRVESELIQVSFDKIMQTRSYTVVILAAPSKRFAIYTDPSIGRTLQMYLTGLEKPRPLTHDLMGMLLDGLNVKIMQVVINDIQDTIYFARLFLEQEIDGQQHIVEIDARPSDCITLALMKDVPVYCTQEVLDKSVPLEE